MELRAGFAHRLVEALAADRHLRVSHRLEESAGLPEVRGQPGQLHRQRRRSEEHTSELQSLMRISYAVFCLKKQKPTALPTTIAASKLSIYQPSHTNQSATVCTQQ